MASRQSTVEPNREAVARRAYELFESRGYEHGRDEDDWLAAEEEFRGAARPGRAPAAKGSRATIPRGASRARKTPAG